VSSLSDYVETSTAVKVTFVEWGPNMLDAVRRREPPFNSSCPACTARRDGFSMIDIHAEMWPNGVDDKGNAAGFFERTLRHMSEIALCFGDADYRTPVSKDWPGIHITDKPSPDVISGSGRWG